MSPKLVVCSYIVVAVASTSLCALLSVDCQRGNSNMLFYQPCAGRAFRRTPISYVKQESVCKPSETELTAISGERQRTGNDAFLSRERTENDAFLGAMDEGSEEKNRIMALELEKCRWEDTEKKLAKLAHVLKGPAGNVNLWCVSRKSGRPGDDRVKLRELSLKFQQVERWWPKYEHRQTLMLHYSTSEDIVNMGIQMFDCFPDVAMHIVYFFHADFGPSYFIPSVPLPDARVNSMHEAEASDPDGLFWRGYYPGFIFSMGSTQRHHQWKTIVLPALKQLGMKVLSPPCGEGPSPSDFGFLHAGAEDEITKQKLWNEENTVTE